MNLILLDLENSKTNSIKKIAEKYQCETELIKDNIYGLIFNPFFNPKGAVNKGVVVCTTNQTQTFSDTDEFQINERFEILKQRFSTIPMAKKKTEQQMNEEEKVSAKEYQRYEEYLITNR